MNRRGLCRVGFTLDFYLFVLAVNSVVYWNLDSGAFICV